MLTTVYTFCFAVLFFNVLPSVTDGKDIMGIDTKGIGSRVRSLRMKRGITQQKLADALGVTLSTVGRIESGIKMASIDLLVDITDFFGTSLDYLVRGKE